MATRQRRNKTQIESLLSIIYFGAGLAGLTLSIVITIVWRYWKDVLNSCMTAQCKNCILYATTLSRTVSGSDTAICKYVAFIPVPIVIWAIIIGSYHGYRVCIRQTKNSAHRRRRSVTFSSEVKRLPNKRHNNSSCYLSLFLIALIITIISIAISIAVTHGYYSTCISYKAAVVKHLSASGNLAAMVQERMTCGTIYDFLDYIQPDPEYLEAKLRRGTYIINTGSLLQLAIISSWLSGFAWVVITILNVFLVFKS